MQEELIDIAQFSKCDFRVGTILSATPLPNARKPAWVLEIDFGPVGVKKSSAQITHHYSPEDLIGQQVIALVNLPPRQIGSIQSECLVLGFPEGKEQNAPVVLIQPERKIENGLKLA